MSIANPVAKIGDIIRGTLLVDRPEQISPLARSIIEQVEKQGGRVYIKNFWADPNPLSKGYVGVHIKIWMPILAEKIHETKGGDQDQKRSILIEFQIHFKAIMDETEGCAKQIAHLLYKKPIESSEEEISSEIVASSQLIYLTAMTRLLATPEELRRVRDTQQLIQAMTKVDEKMRLFIETAMLLGDRQQIGGGKWNDQLKVIVPDDKNAVATAWMNTARKVNAMLHLPALKMDSSCPWTNTATSVDELYADAEQITPFFRKLCRTAADSQPGCTFSFGPNNAFMKKDRKSLLAKINADLNEEIKRFLVQLLVKIGRSWSQVTESAALWNFSELTSLNFSSCSEITDSDLDFLRHLSALQRLNLSNCPQLTDKGLAPLEGRTNLRSLNLSGGRFTNHGLTYLWGLPALTLNVVGCDEITDSGLARAGLQRPHPSSQNSSSGPSKDSYLALVLHLLEKSSIQNDTSISEILEQEAGELLNQDATDLTPKQTKSYQILQKLLVGEKISSVVAKTFRHLHASDEKKTPTVAFHMPELPQTSSTVKPRTSPTAFEVKDPQKAEEGKRPTGAFQAPTLRPKTKPLVNQKPITPEQLERFGLSPGTNLSTLKEVKLTCYPITESDWAFLESLPELQSLKLPQQCTDDDVSQLGGLWALQSLDLSRCERITDSGLAHIGRLLALQSLDLSWCKQITDNGLAHIGRLLALQILYLHACKQITDNGLAHIGRLLALQSLRLSWCKQITDSGLAHIGRFLALQSLDLSLCERITDSGLAHIGRLSALQHLDLNGCEKTTDNGLAHIGRLSALQSLDLSGCKQITDGGLAHVGRLLALQSLNLGGCWEVTDGGLALIGRLSALQSLDLTGFEQITDNGLVHIGRLSALQSLNLSMCLKVTDNGLAHIGRLSALQSLDLCMWEQITDNGLAHVGRLSALQHLYLYRCKQITDSGLAHIGRLSALQHLYLSLCEQITDNGLAHIGRLSALQRLYLSHCKQITDSGLAHIGRLSALQRLDLSECGGITDNGLAHIGRLSTLQDLYLSECGGITDNGLAHIGRLSALLDLTGCDKITPAAKDKLRGQGIYVLVREK